MNLFRDLEDSEVEEFKKWARDNYEPLTPIKGVWHPVVQQECVRINEEKPVIVLPQELCEETLSTKSNTED